MKKLNIIFSALLLFGYIKPGIQESHVRHRTLTQNVLALYDQVYTWFQENRGAVYKAVSAVVFMYGGWRYYCNYVNPFNQKITLNASQCVGCSTTYNGTEIVQLKVKNQFEADGGGAASCGYHSMRNGQEIIQSLTGNVENLGERVLDVQDIEWLFGEQGVWRQAVVQKRNEEGDSGEWLHSEEIEHVMSEQVRFGSFHCIDDMNHFGLQCIPVHQDRPEEFGACITPEIKRALAQDGEYIHQFFINTATHSGESLADSLKNFGHWFVVILHKAAHGAPRFIIADSLNCKRVDDWRVKKLIDELSIKSN